MRTVTARPSFQGDLMIRRLAKTPKGGKPVAPVDGRFIVAHSETGHHHVIEASKNAQLLIDEANALISYLHVAEPTVLEHLREFDTHESLTLEPGWYELRRQVENSPEGWRQVAD